MILAEFLDALLADDDAAVRLVRAAPAIVARRIVDERLVAALPHQLYAGDTALHLAAAAMRPLSVSALIDAGIDVNAENRRGATALHYACDARPNSARTWDPPTQRLIIGRLLDAGSHIEHADKSGSTPLRRAVRGRSPEAVRCLLERGARADAIHGRSRTTPLHLATHSTGASSTKGTHAEREAIIKLLLAHGADPNATDARGKRPRM
jgi:ankyrin repeat protein